MSIIPSTRPAPLRFAAYVTNAAGGGVHNIPRPASARQAASYDYEPWVRLARTLEEWRFDALVFADGGSRQAHSVLAGAIAYSTRHLGIALTSSVLDEHPASFARRMSALDHASGGRAAWHVADDPSGPWTEEYVDVTYKLWEGSWDQDALRPAGRGDSQVQDRKVHRINHQGPRYQVTGPHLASPSPQRTPLMFWAASSETDRALAARNAEAVFIQAPSPAAAGRDTVDIRVRATSHGRLPQDIKFFQNLPVVTGRSPGQVADEVAAWREASVDGISLVTPGSPGPLEEFVRHVAPVLRERGLMQAEYTDGPLRHKLFGHGGLLPEQHPAARYRGAFAPQRAGRRPALVRP